jgi:serine phosphatase RsbU (regulator of sigma subunit)
MNEDGQALLGIEDFAAMRGSYWPDLWSGTDHAAALDAISAAGKGDAARFVGFFTTSRGEAKWWDVVVRPLPGAGHGGLLLAVSRDVTEQHRADAYFRLLAEIGSILDGALDPTETLRGVAATIVRSLADFCAFDLVGEDGTVQRSVCAHRDPNLDEAANRPAQTNRVQRVEQPVAKALRTRKPVLMRGMDGGSAPGVTSCVTVPMLVRGRAVGAMSMALTASGRPYDFDDNDVALALEVARRVTAVLQTAQRYEHELHVATVFQAAALPRELPAVAGFAFDAVYAPASNEAAIGGDWYDAFELPDGRIVITIGDVMGHGLVAAVTMGAIRQTMRAVAITGADPVRVLDVADRTLRLDDQAALATAAVAVLDPQRMMLTCALAGHPPPILRREDGSVSTPFASGGLPLGLRMAREPASQHVTLRPGDLVAFVTDGILEQTRDLRAGERGLEHAIGSREVYAAERPARALYDALRLERTSDDIAILTMRVGAPGWSSSVQRGGAGRG